MLCDSLSDIQQFYDTVILERDSFAFAVDGVVLKVNDLAQQRLLGYTAKGPRFGMAYKLPAEQSTTVVEAITLRRADGQGHSSCRTATGIDCRINS